MENYQDRVNLTWIKIVNPSTGEIFYNPDVETNGSLSLENTQVSNAITASYALNGGGTINTGSLLTTASFDLKNIIFTKGDGSTFSINLQSLAVDSASYATTSQTSQTASYVANTISSSYALTSSYILNAVSASFANTASYVNNLNQNVTIGNITSTPSTENTLNIYPPFAGGTGEGGQMLLAASGGLYSSASMLDTWQNQFRILRGSNTGGSDAGLVYVDLQSGNTQFVGAVTASAYSGLPNSWLHALRTSNQTIGSGTWASRDIVFDQVSSINFTYNASTGIATLKAGKTYRLTARLAWSAAGLYTLKFRVYNQTTSAFTGPTVEMIQSPNGTYNVSDNTLEHVLAVGASDIDISIRTTADTNALTGEYIRGDLNTQLIIQQIA